MSNTTLIIIVLAALCLLFLALKALYKHYLIHCKVLGKKLGKISTFFAEYLGITELVVAFAEFRAKLPWPSRCFLRYAKKHIYLQPSSDDDNSLGLHFEYHSKSLGCYIDPEKLLQLNLPNEVMVHLFSYVLRGRLDLLSLNLSIEDNSKILDATAYSHMIKWVSVSLSRKVKYVLNIQSPDHAEGFREWETIKQHYHLPNLWKYKQPDQNWLKSMIPDTQHYQLLLNEQPMKTDHLRDGYVFLSRCLSFNSLISKMIEYLPRNCAKYQGFSIVPMTKSGLSSADQVKGIVPIYRPRKYVKSGLIGAALLGGTSVLVANFVQVRHQVDAGIKNALTPEHQCLQDNMISPYRYVSVEREVNEAIYHGQDARVRELAILPSGIQHLEQATWVKNINELKIIPLLKSSQDSVQQLALETMLKHGGSQSFKAMIYNNITGWSDVTHIPVNVLQIWLKSNHADIKYVMPRKARNLPSYLSSIQNIHELIAEVNATDSVSEPFIQARQSLEKSWVNKLSAITVLNQISHGENFMSESVQATQLLKHVDAKLDFRQLENMLQCMQRFWMQTQLHQLANAQDLNRWVIAFSFDLENIQQISDKAYRERVLGAFSQQALFILKSKKLQQLPLFEHVSHEQTYSAAFYQKEVQPLYQTVMSLGDGSKHLNLKSIKQLLNEKFMSYGQDYTDYYLQKIREAVKVNPEQVDYFLSRVSDLNSAGQLNSVLTLIQTNITQLPELLDPYMNNVKKAFSGIAQFSSEREKYESLLESYADTLGPIMNEQEKLKAFLFKQHNQFIDSANIMMKSTGLNDSVKDALMQPFQATQQFALEQMRSYLQTNWETFVQPTYDHLLNQFPFNLNGSESASVKEVEEYIGKNGKYWRAYDSYIKPWIKAYPDYQWLTPAQQKTSNHIALLKESLWSVNGAKKPLIVDIGTPNKAPQYRHEASYWFFFSRIVNTQYVASLATGKNKIVYRKHKPAQAQFEIEWWMPSASQVSILNRSGKVVQFHENYGLWSFWKLLSIAKHNQSEFSWDFNKGQTQSAFQIALPSVWQAFVQKV